MSKNNVKIINIINNTSFCQNDNIINENINENKNDKKIILMESQKMALIVANKKAKIYQKEIDHLLKQLFIDNDINEIYFDKFNDYIKNKVKIVMHGKFTLYDLIKCPIIKTCFDLPDNPNAKSRINTYLGTDSYLTWRRKKECIMFNRSYGKDDERPKYASINIGLEEDGNPLCASYGETVLFFKNEIKNRTTFLWGNSSENDYYICTFNYPLLLLYHMRSDLKKIIDLLDNNKKSLSKYIEAQIHGEINIERDVDKIVIKKEKYNEFDIKLFCEKYPNILLKYI